ncbi:hypothetical protein UFOVP51_26 [uncultured Caudovirales phage]|uniref:Uncharacterized protein n=1 Tax=uncultured Caudovirales phage TaxID=2100421 RepID=A0A6J5TC61_9CAUD|nr:hypothetical protein UFOVP51_26 [uncultured Caudovirales phage]CAB4241110.1 hypothetical protein UFOVP34_80 [uncultured Caudovirales phage]
MKEMMSFFEANLLNAQKIRKEKGLEDLNIDEIVDLYKKSTKGNDEILNFYKDYPGFLEEIEFRMYKTFDPYDYEAHELYSEIFNKIATYPKLSQFLRREINLKGE